MTETCTYHKKGDGSWELHDGHGIYLTRVCAKCQTAKLSRFRPDIMEAYECDEPIEAEDY